MRERERVRECHHNMLLKTYTTHNNIVERQSHMPGFYHSLSLSLSPCPISIVHRPISLFLSISLLFLSCYSVWISPNLENCCMHHTYCTFRQYIRSFLAAHTHYSAASFSIGVNCASQIYTSTLISSGSGRHTKQPE